MVHFIKPTDVTGKKKKKMLSETVCLQVWNRRTKPKVWETWFVFVSPKLDNWQRKSLLDVKYRRILLRGKWPLSPLHNQSLSLTPRDCSNECFWPGVPVTDVNTFVLKDPVFSWEGCRGWGWIHGNNAVGGCSKIVLLLHKFEVAEDAFHVD